MNVAITLRERIVTKHIENAKFVQIEKNQWNYVCVLVNLFNREIIKSDFLYSLLINIHILL